MSRPKKIGGSVRHSIYLPTDLSNTIHLLLTNPLTGRPAYGSLSSLITAQLSRWVQERRGRPPGTSPELPSPEQRDFFCQECGAAWQGLSLPSMSVLCPSCASARVNYLDLSSPSPKIVPWPANRKELPE